MGYECNSLRLDFDFISGWRITRSLQKPRDASRQIESCFYYFPGNSSRCIRFYSESDSSRSEKP